jgi:enoyl-CoA hydratase/carnithine racemase
LAQANLIAREIVDHTAPVAVAITRQLLWRFTGDATPFDLNRIDSELNRALGASADVREGVSAFLEKRPPQFPGRVSADMPPGYPWWE